MLYPMPMLCLTASINMVQQALANGGQLTNVQQASLTQTLEQLFGQAFLPITAPHAHHANQVSTTHLVTPQTLNQESDIARQATLNTLLSVFRILQGASTYQPSTVTWPDIVIPRINGLSDSTEAQASQERKRTSSTCASEKRSNNGNGDNAINYGNGYTGETIAVHNPDLVPWIKPQYSQQDRQVVFALLSQHGVFTLVTEPNTGLIETADASGSAVMHQHRWQTDNMLCAPLQQAQDPSGWLQNLTTQAAFLSHTEVLQAFKQAIANPDWFRKGGDKNGVPHLFIPDTITFDLLTGLPHPDSITLGHSWFSNQRLESQALVLLAMAQSITQGLWPPNDARLQTLVIPAMAHLAQYLLAVNTNPTTNLPDFAAPSISSWEEAPYAGGMTWDTAVTVLAFQALQPILFDPIPAYAPIRQALENTAMAMDPNTQLFNPQAIVHFMAIGHQQVLARIVRPLQAGGLPMQHPKRPMDMSLAFVVSHAYPLDADDPIETARLHLQLIACLKHYLMRDHGMIRYPAHTVNGHKVVDSYLASDFWMPDEYRQALAKQICNSVVIKEVTKAPELDDRLMQDMLERQAIMQPNSEAQWCLGVSAILQGLSKLYQSLEPMASARPEARAVLQQVETEWDYWLARNLALLTGNDSTRSNGSLCQPWRVMEAYEQVSVPSALSASRVAYRQAVPGAHTLAWGQAQLYAAFINR
jgi:hypothetical protein